MGYSHSLNRGVSWFQGLFCSFVSLSGPARWLHEQFVKWHSLAAWLLHQASLGLGHLWSISSHCLLLLSSILLWSWVYSHCGTPVSVQQVTTGKNDPIDVVRSKPRPGSREDDLYRERFANEWVNDNFIYICLKNTHWLLNLENSFIYVGTRFLE